MGGGAWPFLVGGVICLVNSDNERDLNLLNSNANSSLGGAPLCSRAGRGPPGGSAAKEKKFLFFLLLRGTVGV